MKSDNRPLSPHIQIYKPQITSITSIMHRITGVILYFSILILCLAITYYTYQINTMAEGYVIECDCLWKVVLKYVFYIAGCGFAFSLYYHLFNGIRHLLWNIGKGFEIKDAKKTGIIVLLFSALATAANIIYIFCFYS